MQDRISTHPGRFRIMPVLGQQNVYDLTRADDPQQTGTPLNTLNLLEDDLAEYLTYEMGIEPEDEGAVQTPNDALWTIYSLICGLTSEFIHLTRGSYIGKGVAGEANPNELEFDFRPSLLLLVDPNGRLRYTTDGKPAICCPRVLISRTYQQDALFSCASGSIWAKASDDLFTIYWYHDGGSPAAQFNESGVRYWYVAFGKRYG